MRTLLVLALTACSSRGIPVKQDAGIADAAIEAAIDAEVVRPDAPPPPPRGAVHGTHVVPIAQLAITPAGDAAATVDLNGNVRVWPSFDGKREPAVVTASAPTNIAIVSDRSDHVIAVVDHPGTLELVRMNANGDQVSRIQVADEIRDVHAIEHAFLAVARDQTIELFDVMGHRGARLQLGRSERLEAIVVRNARALALVAVGSKVYGRWIDGAAWGARTYELPIDPQRTVLSPDFRHLATRIAGKAAIFDLQTGAIVELGKRFEPYGISDDNVVYCGGRDGMVSRWSIAGKLLGSVDADELAEGIAGPADPMSGPIAIAGNALVFGFAQELAIVARRIRYLGYRTHGSGIDQLRSTPVGVLVPNLETGTSVVIDSHLRVRRSYTDDIAFPVDASGTIKVAHGSPGYRVIAGNSTVDAYYSNVEWEPSTQILATHGMSELAELHHYDRKLKKLEPLDIQMSGQLYLLDPALSGGRVAIGVRPEYTAHWTRLEILRKGATTLDVGEVEGAVETIDRAGNIYTRAYNADGVSPFVRHGKLKIRAKMILPSPDAKYVAAVTESSVVMMYTADGTKLWEQRLASLSELAWTPDNELIANVSLGFAHIDRATGQLRERQCGFDFGLYDEPLPATNVIRLQVRSICDDL